MPGVHAVDHPPLDHGAHSRRAGQGGTRRHHRQAQEPDRLCEGLGYEGPVFGLQSYTTSTNGTEFCTFTVFLVAKGAKEMERLTLTTKAFLGRHTADAFAPWFREVRGRILKEAVLGWVLLLFGVAVVL